MAEGQRENVRSATSAGAAECNDEKRGEENAKETHLHTNELTEENGLSKSERRAARRA